MSKINYQVMNDEQMVDGKYFPDYERLMQNATDVEEVSYIREIEKGNFGFSYNLVYVTKQTCGHYEIFQTPLNNHYPLSDSLRLAKERSESSQCTACICSFRPITKL